MTARWTGRRRLPDPCGLPECSGQRSPTGRRRHALVTDGTIALRARQSRLAVGVAVAVARARPSGLAYRRARPCRLHPGGERAGSRRHRRRRRPGDLVDRAGARVGLRAGALLRRDRGGAGAARPSSATRRSSAASGTAVVDRRASTSAPRRASSPGRRRRRTLILTTTNGTRAILTAAARCDIVLLGSLLNLSRGRRRRRARTAATSRSSAPASRATFALDDAYCAGRIVDALGGERSDAAIAAEVRRARLAVAARGAERTDLRAARARSRHRVLRPGRSAPDGAALRAHGRYRRPRSSREAPRGTAVARDRAFRLAWLPAYARRDTATLHVSLAELDGVIGGHDAASAQRARRRPRPCRRLDARRDAPSSVCGRPSSGRKGNGTRRVLSNRRPCYSWKECSNERRPSGCSAMRTSIGTARPAVRWATSGRKARRSCC